MPGLSYSDLLSRHPTEILGLITPFLEGQEGSGDFPWEVFADTCDCKARELATSHPSLSLQWAAVTVRIYDRLSRNATGSSLQSIERHAMSLRSTLIKLFGPQAGDPVLDPRTVEDWFFSRNGLHLHVVLSTQDDNDELFWSLDYAYLCERLKVLLPLLAAGYCTRQDELSQWKSALHF